jgi:hypothetical protein
MKRCRLPGLLLFALPGLLLFALPLLLGGCGGSPSPGAIEPPPPAAAAASLLPTEPAGGTAASTTGGATGSAPGSAPGAATPPGALLPPTPPPFSTGGWSTDFTQRTVAWEEILSGGPPKDGIPAIDAPVFESVDAAATWLSDRDPVILFAAGADVRAYPLAVLIWHEIANDTVGGRPVAVTFCPLCNASIVFDRTFDGQVLDFGTTGKLRNSDLIMYDRQTETWWQQFTGQGIVGEHAGAQLAFLPSQVISFGDFAAEFPAGQVLARPPLGRSYGANPYTSYDTTDRPFLFSGAIDSRLPATERVAGVVLGETVKAYPFPTAAAAGAINDTAGGIPLVVFHKEGTASALDSGAIAEGRDVGSVAVFDRRVGDRTLTFTADGGGTFVDAETGSRWNILGEAVAGELAGERLAQQLAFDHFWFAWAAFHPTTELYQAP